MVFGAPWWDHLFPLLMYMRGCCIYQTEPVALHLKHTERWSWPVLIALGQRFRSEIETRAGDKKYRSRFEDAVKRRRTGRLLSDLTYNLWKRLPKYAAGEPDRILNRVAAANVSFLDEISRSGTLSRAIWG